MPDPEPRVRQPMLVPPNDSLSTSDVATALRDALHGTGERGRLDRQLLQQAIQDSRVEVQERGTGRR